MFGKDRTTNENKMANWIAPSCHHRQQQRQHQHHSVVSRRQLDWQLARTQNRKTSELGTLFGVCRLVRKANLPRMAQGRLRKQARAAGNQVLLPLLNTLPRNMLATKPCKHQPATVSLITRLILPTVFLACLLMSELSTTAILSSLS